jgi:anthranilate synthase/aminodeoxychorismate synthase-like glutamine amidotransferase
MHGKTDEIQHDDHGLFAGIVNPFIATRYHSLVIEPESLPAELLVSAWTNTGGAKQIMGVRHREHKLEGWQFHPESFLTEPGIELLKRFLRW